MIHIHHYMMGPLSAVLHKHISQKQLIGILSIAVAVSILPLDIIYYPSLLPKIINSQNSFWIEQTSYIFYSLLIGSFILVIYGCRCLCIQNPNTFSILSPSSQTGQHFGLLTIINNIIFNKNNFKIFLPASISYGIFYAIVSGMLVFKPEGILAMHDSGGITIPSIIITPYGPIGYVPIFSVYFTEQLGLLIIPINLLIAVFISSLVGVNIVMSAYAFKNLRKKPIANKSKGSALSLLAASIGLFAACPTCASFYIFSFMAASIVSTIISFTAVLNIVFLITSIPMLLIGIFMTAASIRKMTSESCPSIK
jgi:hypothetical protein